MERELRILILEDEVNDAELMEDELRKAGMSFTPKRVDTREDFLQATIGFSPDLILADCLLPSFDGLSALAIAREKCPDVPFIFVSGAMGEDFAIEAFKRGGTDYVLKQRLPRLVPAVDRALREAKERAERKRIEEALWTSAREWRTTCDAINDLVALMDSDGRILRCNRAMANLLEKPFDKIVGHRCFELLHGTSKPIKGCPFFRMQKTHGRESRVLAVQDRWFNIAVDPLVDQEGKIVGGVHIMSDITERKQMEEKLRTLSFVDDLTGLYNRRGFLTLAEQQLKISNRTKGKMLLFFIDLDQMKWINDTFGHPEGDQALREIATILRETFRESDIIARMGGDEFVVLTLESNGESEDLLTARLRANIMYHNNAEGSRNFRLSISMGTATYDPRSPCLIDELLEQADQSMYEQKRMKQKTVINRNSGTYFKEASLKSKATPLNR